ncbi:MAG: hypothetical protein DRZ76_02880 [Candidatus Nealsonbacteria bacterium]|nr:MAG: hypothetical protein DRZ76_02880 [Candidatus Nealsonbacteria bacterium]
MKRILVGIGIVLALPLYSVDFGTVNKQVSWFFWNEMVNNDIVVLPTTNPERLLSSLPVLGREESASMDSILYVGLYDPYETLSVIDTNRYFNCNIAVVNHGVLLFDNSSVRVHGSIIALHHGKVIVDSTHLRLVSEFEWQFAMATLDSSSLLITNSQFDYNGYPGYTSIKDYSSMYVQNSCYTHTTALYTQHARVTYSNVTGGGEHSARDSSHVSFTNVELASIHVTIPESASVDLTFPYDTLAFIEHWEINPSSPFASGIGYSLSIDSSYCMFDPSCASGCELTLSDAESHILIRFTSPTTDTISGLINGNYYDEWTAPFADRTIHLINTTIDCWHLQMFSSSDITLKNSIIGEFICFDSSKASLINSVHDGRGGPLNASGHSVVYVANTNIQATAKARANGLLVLSFCTTWEDFFASDSALILSLGTYSLNPPRVFDAAAVIVASIKSPIDALVNDSVAIIGDAYIERTSASLYDFDAFRLWYVHYPIDTLIDIDSLIWTPITDWVTYQVRDDTLAVWDTHGLDVGRYILRIVWREALGDTIYTFYKMYLREGTSIDESVLSPRKLLFSVYPNPFNTSCRIDVPADAEIEIFNLLGNVVGTIHKPIKEGTFVWEPDESIGSGVYLVRMTTSDRALVRRVIYLR